MSRSLRRLKCHHGSRAHGRESVTDMGSPLCPRKVIVEPVLGQIKEARGFQSALLRALDRIQVGCLCV